MLDVVQSKTPGSELYRDGDYWVERGSVWYWLTNRRFYGKLEPNITRLLIKKLPNVHKELRLVERNVTDGSALYPFEFSDRWVADDPIERAKIAWMTIIIEAPFPIRTQFFKHKYGFVENEVSRRYVSDPPRFFAPDCWRGKAENIKQGSTHAPIRHQWLAHLIAQGVYRLSDWGYRALLALDVCPEQARFLTSQGMMTQWYWTGSLDAIARAWRLRSDPHAQEESWQLAHRLKEHATLLWPKTSQTLF